MQIAKAHTALQSVYNTFELQAPNLSLAGQQSTTYFPHEGDLEVFYFHPDHLGSSSYITNLDGNVTQHMEYLPFGEILVDEHTNSNNSPFKFNGKELDEETGNYYYGARYYNPKWSIWLSVDPLAEKYPALSPYAYVANNPINAIDPDGRLIIFLNGQHVGEGGNGSYWGGLDSRIIKRIGDRHVRYYDGGTGGFVNTVFAPIWRNNLIPGNRRRAGKRMAYNQAESIFSSLGEGETIKIATHSMGGAYGKGFIKGLKKYAKENDIDITGLIEFEIDLAPYQSNFQEAQEGVPTIVIAHEGDIVAGSDPVSGAENNVTRQGKKKGLSEHSVDSFTQEEINRFVPKSENNRPGSSVWEQKPKNE